LKKIILFLIFGAFFFLTNLHSKEFNTNWTECFVDKYYKNSKFKGPPNGKADCISENGDLYSGFFNRGIANGTIYIHRPTTTENKFGELKFLGDFKNNQPDNGSYYFEHGSEFDGNFKTTRKPEYFKGDFKNNKPWNGYIVWSEPYERKAVVDGKIDFIGAKSSSSYNQVFYQSSNNTDDNSFGFVILALLIVLIFILSFKSFKNKKVFKKNNTRKITPKAYSQQNFSSFVFWNGQKGLALTFWGFFVGGNGLFNLVTVIFADNSTLLTFNLIFFVIWNVLSVMGVFNAADIYKSEKIKRGLSYTPATAAKVAVVLLILSGIGNALPK
jgi:hypothetical protein